MAPTPPPPTGPTKHEYADIVLKKWRKIRDLMSNPTQRDRIVKNWMKSNAGKRRKKLRQRWEKMPEKLHPDFEGILSWRPHDVHHEPTLEELKNGTVLKRPLWKEALNRDKVLWSQYNVEGLQKDPAPLLEMLYNRASRTPAEFFDDDMEEYAIFKLQFLPEPKRPTKVARWMTVWDPEAAYSTYGDIHCAPTKEDRLEHSSEGMRPSSDGDIVLEIQAKVYTFLADMCKAAIGADDYNNAPELTYEDAQNAGFGKPEWRPQAPDKKADDDDAKLKDYLAQCRRFQDYKYHEDIDWEFLKRLADAERMKARDVLLGMREDPQKFHENLLETMELQPVGMESDYERWATLSFKEFRDQLSPKRRRELEDEGAETFEAWAVVHKTRQKELAQLEFELGARQIRKLRDSIFTAIHVYECWSHIFRLIVRMGSRWEEYQAWFYEQNHCHEELEVDFKTMCRLIQGLDHVDDIEPRNSDYRFHLTAEKAFRDYYSRRVRCGFGEDSGKLMEIERNRESWPPDNDPETIHKVKMMARLEASQANLIEYWGVLRVLIEDTIQCAEDTGLKLSPKTRRSMEYKDACAVIMTSIQRHYWLLQLLMTTSATTDEENRRADEEDKKADDEQKEGEKQDDNEGGDKNDDKDDDKDKDETEDDNAKEEGKNSEYEEYLGRASELMAKVQALKNVNYQGASYNSTPWGKLVPHMKTALTFERYYEPGLCPRRLREKNIQIEQNLAKFWQEFDKMFAVGLPGLPDYTKQLLAEAVPLATVPDRPDSQEPSKEEVPLPLPRQNPRKRTYAEREEQSKAPVESVREAESPQRGEPTAKVEQQERIRKLREATEENPVPIHNRQAWDLIETVFGNEIQAAATQQTVTWAEIKRMCEHIGYDVSPTGHGSVWKFTPLKALRKRGFTTGLTLHRPHDGKFTGFQARRWVQNREHGLVTKGWSFECFKKEV